MANTDAPYLITGAVVPPSSTSDHVPPPPRQDICELRENEKNKYQFTLFILAWNKITQPGYEPKAASFHEIAGIHGMPYTRWLGDPDESPQTDRGPFLGYCNHGSILFPTWHRPQLMLLEQTISDVAVGIAGDLAAESRSQDESKEWLKAAEDLRLPFWDWTHPRTGDTGIPDFFQTPTIWLYMPNGHEVEHKNPLYAYELIKPVDGFNNRYQSNRIYDQSGRAYFKEWKRTYRHPESRTTGATDGYEQINARLTGRTTAGQPLDNEIEVPGWKEGSWAQLARSVSQIFAFPTDVEQPLWANVWDEFSNTTVQSAPGRDGNGQPKRRYKSATSLESSHNTVHLVVGGIGHMGDNDTASFDPIFFLHHCNVDRLLSFWQHIYPDYVAGMDGYYVDEGKPRGRFTQPDGTWIQQTNLELNEETPLVPFRNGGYKYWTSKQTHSLKYTTPTNIQNGPVSNKSYTYPPIVTASGVRIEINTDPAKQPSKNLRSIQRRFLQNHFGYDARYARENAPRVTQKLFSTPSPYHNRVDHMREPVENFRQFVVAVDLDPHLVGGSYSAVILFKLLDTKPPFEIGQVSVLSRGRSDLCGNCQGQRATGARVHGTVLVPHTLVARALSDAGLTGDTTNERVIMLVWSRLEARLQLPDGTNYADLTDSLHGSVDPSPKDPVMHLLSCDVYLQRESEPLDDPVEDKKVLDELPYEFDDWTFHSSLLKVPPGSPGHGERPKRKWTVY